MRFRPATVRRLPGAAARRGLEPYRRPDGLLGVRAVHRGDDARLPAVQRLGRRRRAAPSRSFPRRRRATSGACRRAWPAADRVDPGGGDADLQPHPAERRDGSEFARTIIPRVKVEYQPTRALFVRVVGEYRSQRQAALRDAGHGRPAAGERRAVAAEMSNGLRIDSLFSYEPTPARWRSSATAARWPPSATSACAGSTGRPTGFFLKLAYQIRR